MRTHGFSVGGRSFTLMVAGWLIACGGSDPAPRTERAAIALAPAEAASPPAAPVSEASTEPAAVTAVPGGTSTYEEADAAFRRGRYETAAGLFEVLVRDQPASGQSHYMLGLSAWKSGNRGRAEEALVRAVELDEGSVKARTNLSRVLLEQGRPADALPHLESALELAPEAHEVWRVYGNAMSELGRSDEALEAYRQAIMLHEADAWSMNNYGLVLIRQGRYDDALPPLARAVQLVPGSPVFQNNLGVALERSGRPHAARAAYAAAVAADSTYVRARTSLERVDAVQASFDDGAFDVSELVARFLAELELWREMSHGC
jgi:Flp pilus assembly protein TadD